jgi:hypothetical protein
MIEAYDIKFIADENIITVELQAEEIEAKFAEQDGETVKVEFGQSEREFKAEFGEISKIPSNDYPLYTGALSVVPSTEEQTLKTAQTYVAQDITVKKIPYAEVTNNSRGKTVTIA